MKVLLKKYIYKKIIIKPYYKFKEYIRIIAKITMSKRKQNEIEIIKEEIFQKINLNDKRIKRKLLEIQMYDTFKERNIKIYKTIAQINKEIDNQKLLRFELQEDRGKNLYGQFKSYPFIIQYKNYKNPIHVKEIIKLKRTLIREKNKTIRVIITLKFTSRAVIKYKINNKIEIQQRLIIKTRNKSLLKEIDFKRKLAEYIQTIYEDKKYIQKRKLRIQGLRNIYFNEKNNI